MAERVILLPVAHDERFDKDGNQTANVIPETWGSHAEAVTVVVNYHDVCKVRMRGTDKEIAELAERSRSYFAEAWKPRED